MQELDPITRLEYRVSELERQMGQLQQMAVVSYVYRKAGEEGIQSDRDDGSWLGYVDVIVDDLPLHRIPTVTRRLGNDRTHWLPSEGETGYLMCASGDYANAVFMPATTVKNADRLVPAGHSLKQRVTRYRDNIERVTDTEQHFETLNVPHDSGRIKETVGAGDASVRKQEQPKITDQVGKATETIETDKIESIIRGTLQNAGEKLEIDLYEVHLPNGNIQLKIGKPIVTAEIDISESEIDIRVGTNRLRVNATEVEMRTLTTWVVANAALVNVNGATFTAGLTNLIGNLAAPVIYTPVPA